MDDLKTPSQTFVFNYTKFLIMAISLLAMMIIPMIIDSWQSSIILWSAIESFAIIIFALIITFFFVVVISYYPKIIISDESITIYHWFSKNTQTIYPEQIKALMIKESQSGELGSTIEMVVLKDRINTNDNNDNKIINIFTHSYILKGFNRQQSAQQLQDKLISFVDNPDKVTDIQDKQRLDKFELVAWARVLVFFVLALYIFWQCFMWI